MLFTLFMNLSPWIRWPLIVLGCFWLGAIIIVPFSINSIFVKLNLTNELVSELIQKTKLCEDIVENNHKVVSLILGHLVRERNGKDKTDKTE